MRTQLTSKHYGTKVQSYSSADWDSSKVKQHNATGNHCILHFDFKKAWDIILVLNEKQTYPKCRTKGHNRFPGRCKPVQN